MGERKKILIIGETMLDKTIIVSDPIEDNTRSYKTYRKSKSFKLTFGGVFFISRYLQHFENVDITVINILPKLTKDILENYNEFSEKFEEFSENDILSDIVDIEGSRDYIHSITRFVTVDSENPQNWDIRFQIENYYAPNKKYINDNKTKYTYSTGKKSKIFTKITETIDNWKNDNNNEDKRILIMDYDLGLFDESNGLLNELGVYFNDNIELPVIIYSGYKYDKFNIFKNAHIITYSPDIYKNEKDHKSNFKEVKKSKYCFRSISFVSSKYTQIVVLPFTKHEDIRIVPTDGSTGSNLDLPRTGHKAIVAAHLAMSVIHKFDNSLLNTRWIEEAHLNSKIITSKLLSDNFIEKEWKQYNYKEIFSSSKPIQ